MSYVVRTQSPQTESFGSFGTPDAAYDAAKKYSRNRMGPLIVWDEGRVSVRRVRAFGVGGLLSFPKPCRPCGGSGKGASSTVSCIACTSSMFGHGFGGVSKCRACSGKGSIQIQPDCQICRGLGQVPEGAS